MRVNDSKIAPRRHTSLQKPVRVKTVKVEIVDTVCLHPSQVLCGLHKDMNMTTQAGLADSVLVVSLRNKALIPSKCFPEIKHYENVPMQYT